MTSIREAQRGARRQGPGGEFSARRQATRERLMDAAVELFAERGVLAASVEEICERAGFTRGAFYSNFDSKDELCLDVLRRKGEQHLVALQQVVESMPGAGSGLSRAQVIRDAVGLFLQAQPKERTELIAMMELRLHALRTPELREGWLAVHANLCASIAGQLQMALDRVGGRIGMPMPQVIELLGAMYENTVSMSLLNGEDAPTGLTAQLVALLDGLIQD